MGIRGWLLRRLEPQTPELVRWNGARYFAHEPARITQPEFFGLGFQPGHSASAAPPLV